MTSANASSAAPRSGVRNGFVLPPSKVSQSIFVAAGADGILDGCFRAFVAPGDKVQLFEPTYPVLNLLSAVYSAVPIKSAWPPEVSAEDVSITFVVNPNSPTGSWVAAAKLIRFVGQEKNIVVVDEAYAPFAGQSVACLVDDHPNLVVVRTFSKAYSLAGMRVGYAVCSAELAAELMAAHLPYPTNSCASFPALTQNDSASRYPTLTRTTRFWPQPNFARVPEMLASPGRVPQNE